MSWAFAVFVVFLAYMGFDKWIDEYHKYKAMEYKEYLEQKKGRD